MINQRNVHSKDQSCEQGSRDVIKNVENKLFKFLKEYQRNLTKNANNVNNFKKQQDEEI